MTNRAQSLDRSLLHFIGSLQANELHSRVPFTIKASNSLFAESALAAMRKRFSSTATTLTSWFLSGPKTRQACSVFWQTRRKMFLVYHRLLIQCSSILTPQLK